jgi:exopolysaccharide biosynthesis protein
MHIKRKLSVLGIFTLSLTISLLAGVPDSVATRTVEPGVEHMTFFKSGPYVIDVLVVDLRAKNLQVESFRPGGLVKTSEQAKQNDREDHNVVAAINADFFSFTTGWPVNNQIMNGQFVIGSPTQRSHLAIDIDGKPFVDKFGLSAWIKPKNGKVYPIDAVNDTHRENSIVLHTTFSDTATNFSGQGVSYLLRLAGSSWSIGDTLKMAVTRNGVSYLMHIAKDQAVLWIGSGPEVRSACEDVKVGDTVLVYLGTQPPLRHVRTMVGGVGMILSDGKPVSDSMNVKEKTNVTFLNARHPRTFVGFDRDSTRLFLCVVDGRQERSIGMNFKEMADFLHSIGVWNAVNLDGGGSTTMVIHKKIVNSPSDKTGERPVANTLQIIRMNLPPSGK